MSTRILWQSPKITVWHHPDARLVHHEIHQYCYGDAFRDALTAGAEALALHRADRWLSDDRRNGPVSPEDDAWINSTWFPRATAAGWRYWALVPPTAMVGQMNVARTAKLFEQHGLVVRTFTTPELAMVWLADPR